MIRIAQQSFPEAVCDRLMHDRDLLVSMMREHLPQRFLGMFPQPQRLSSEQLVWHSEMSGPLRMFADLAPRQREQVLETLRQRFESIHQVIVARRHAGDVSLEQATRLHDMLNSIPQQALALVGEEPLVLYWNSAMPPGSTLPLLPLLPLQPFVAPLDDPTQARATRGRGFFWWLLALLALGLLLWALWWFFCPISPRNTPEPIPPEPVVELPVETPLAEPVPEPKPEPPPEPVLAPDPEPVVQPPVQEPKPPEPPKPPVKPPEPPKPPKPPAKKAVTITSAKEFCPEERPADLVPELVVVFDTSGSMDLNIATTSEQEEAYYQNIWRRNSLAGLLGQIDERFIAQMEREPKRITVAKSAVADVVKGLPKDVKVGLVTARTCPSADFKGFFEPQRRSALLGQIQALKPDGGTPLADALRRAGQVLDGKGRESTILVVTDGVESCNGDPCAVARQLAASKPHLKINVVDIGHSGSGHCLANATGGSVYTANSIASLKLGVERATREVQGPAHCR